jgi:hypothetical protein
MLLFTGNRIASQILYGAWRRPEARLNGVQEVAGSNPVAPIFLPETDAIKISYRSQWLKDYNNNEFLSQHTQSCVSNSPNILPDRFRNFKSDVNSRLPDATPVLSRD